MKKTKILLSCIRRKSKAALIGTSNGPKHTGILFPAKSSFEGDNEPNL